MDATNESGVDLDGMSVEKLKRLRFDVERRLAQERAKLGPFLSEVRRGYPENGRSNVEAAWDGGFAFTHNERGASALWHGTFVATVPGTSRLTAARLRRLVVEANGASVLMEHVDRVAAFLQAESENALRQGDDARATAWAKEAREARAVVGALRAHDGWREREEYLRHL